MMRRPAGLEPHQARWQRSEKSSSLLPDRLGDHNAPRSINAMNLKHEENPTLYLPIGKDLVGLLKPRWLRIGGYWFPRGGMPTASRQRECGSRIKCCSLSRPRLTEGLATGTRRFA